MTTKLRLIATYIVLLCAPLHVIAQTEYIDDVIMLEGVPHLRRHFLPLPFPSGGLQDSGQIVHSLERCAIAAYHNDPFELSYLYFRSFADWGQPRHSIISVDPDYSISSHECVAHPVTNGTLVTWYDASRGTVWLRRYDSSGIPIEPRERVIEDVYLGSPITLQCYANDERVAILLNDYPDARDKGRPIQWDVLMRIYTVDGQPISDVLPVATNQYYSEERCSATVQSDGSVMVAFCYGNRALDNWRLYLRRINPDMSMEPRVLVTEEHANWAYIRALADGTLLVVYRLMTEPSTSFVRRFDAFGQPLSEPVPVDPDWAWASATSDGRLALGYYVTLDPPLLGEPWIQRYNADWQPVGGRFVPVSAEMFSTYAEQDRPLAYAEDGSIWHIGTADYNPGGTLETVMTVIKPFTPGDLNDDGLVDNFDIDPFVLALTDPEEYQQLYPELPYQFLGDLNFDGEFNNFDIDRFVEALTGS